VEILDLRHFSSADLVPCLRTRFGSGARALLGLQWIGGDDSALRGRKNPARLRCHRARRIVGYAFFVYEGSKGVIGDLFVANGGRLPDPHEVESRLLLHMVETLQQSPGIHRVEAQLLVHEAGVVARPFVEQDFSATSVCYGAAPERCLEDSTTAGP